MNNKWMHTPTQPNWEAIYKELNTNGIENLTELPMSVFQDIQNGMNTPIPDRGRPINGDSQMDRHWLSNQTVGDMIEQSKQLGYVDSGLTDVERRIGRTMPEYVDGSDLSQFKDLTVGDMIDHSTEKGYSLDNMLPDEQRYSADQLTANVSQADRALINKQYEEANVISSQRNAEVTNRKNQQARIKNTREQIKNNPTKNVFGGDAMPIDIPSLSSSSLVDTTRPIAPGLNVLEQNNKIYSYDSSADIRLRPREVKPKTVVASSGIDDVGQSHLKKALGKNAIGSLVNIGFAWNDYNEAREAGDGVVKSAVKAGAMFVAGEALGMGMMPVMLMKSAPQMAISAIEGTQKMTRQMNSLSRVQTFGEAQFMDTQQLGTMRQAGMEMAKMSQYNLQQSIMGNEAQYMHRI